VPSCRPPRPAPKPTTSPGDPDRPCTGAWGRHRLRTTQGGPVAVIDNAGCRSRVIGKAGTAQRIRRHGRVYVIHAAVLGKRCACSRHIAETILLRGRLAASKKRPRLPPTAATGANWDVPARPYRHAGDCMRAGRAGKPPPGGPPAVNGQGLASRIPTCDDKRPGQVISAGPNRPFVPTGFGQKARPPVAPATAGGPASSKAVEDRVGTAERLFCPERGLAGVAAHHALILRLPVWEPLQNGK
jgi:hypothetical protein